MLYPESLVHQYGAKAGLLIYVANELPDIPQVDMVVSEPGESTQSLLERADRFPILWPRLFRSSAVAELDGYEGEFQTAKLDGFEEGHERIAWNPMNFGCYRNREYFDRYIRQTVDGIRTSPQQFKAVGLGAELPDEINVIIAEKSPSEYIGTLVKHPNKDDFYIMALTTSESVDGNNPNRSAFSYSPRQGVEEYTRFSQRDIKLTSTIEQDLKTVVAWHDRIVDLPDLDKKWTYQLEFGIDPPCLFQVRPFLRKQKVDFRLKADDFNQPLVFGVTKEDGIDVRVETNVWERRCNGEAINPDNQPSVFFSELRESRSWEDVPNLQVTMLTSCLGILAHGDIRAIRQVQVAALYSYNPLGYDESLQGKWINIASDGNTARIRTIKAPKLT